jgi:hypothetical protein
MPQYGRDTRRRGKRRSDIVTFLHPFSLLALPAVTDPIRSVIPARVLDRRSPTNCESIGSKRYYAHTVVIMAILAH